MKKPLIIIIVVIVIVIIGWGVFFTFTQTDWFGNKTNEAEKIHEKCSQFSEESEEYFNCYIDSAKELKNPKICTTNENEFFKYICLSTVYEDEISKGECEKTPEYFQEDCYLILSRIDISACEKITNLEKRDSCYDQSNFENPDAENCIKIQNLDLRNGCYFTTAEKTNDAELCSKLSDEYLESACIQAVGKSTGEVNCEVLDDSDNRDWCHFENAKNKDDVSYCFLIESGITMYDCYYRNGFFINNGPEICEKINAVSAGEKQALAQCFNVFIELGDITDSKLCETYDVSCNSTLAANTKDISFCETAEDWEKNNCYTEFAIATLDTNICDLIPRASAASIEVCKKRVKAISENNPSYCEELNSKDCYEDYAIYFKDAEYCKKLLVPHQKMCELRSQ